MPAPAGKARYTYADVLSWPEDELIEILGGEVFIMATPSRIHQEISGELFRQLANYLEGRQCKVFYAPFGVRLFERDGDSPEDVDTVVEPDIVIVCDQGKLDKYGCKGSPDFIAEILSPSTLRHDRLVKLNYYQQAGVREYWIVDPENKSVQVFLPDSGKSLRLSEDYDQGAIAKVNILDGCFIELPKVFRG